VEETVEETVVILAVPILEAEAVLDMALVEVLVVVVDQASLLFVTLAANKPPAELLTQQADIHITPLQRVAHLQLQLLK
jgi:hypothetical protein